MCGIGLGTAGHEGWSSSSSSAHAGPILEPSTTAAPVLAAVPKNLRRERRRQARLDGESCFSCPRDSFFIGWLLPTLTVSISNVDLASIRVLTHEKLRFHTLHEKRNFHDSRIQYLCQTPKLKIFKTMA